MPELACDCPDFVFSGVDYGVDEFRRKKRLG